MNRRQAISFILRAAALFVLSLGVTPLHGIPQEAWVPEIPDGPDPIGAVDISTAPDGIVSLPDTAHPVLQQTFRYYTHVVAPNGKPIRFLAQDGWRRDQIVKARNVLIHILTDAPGTKYGSDKSAIANAMADRRATLVMFRTARDMERAMRGRLGSLEMGFQDLRANECPVEGDPDYLAHETRDASYEEILHMVHDYGIRPAIPEYDNLLHNANLAFARRGLWDGWPEEEPENHRNEYFAAAYDNYLDLWLPKPTKYEGMNVEDDMIPDGTSHFGAFGAHSRSKLKKVDPKGFALIESFFPDHLTYNAILAASFEGTFVMHVKKGVRYSHKAQHLRHVTLSGTHAANILANNHDNTLTGNISGNAIDGMGGNDKLRGLGGDDVLRGGAGTDVAIYRGKMDEYEIVRVDGVLTVRDLQPDRDGTDQLYAIESLQFVDGVHRVEDEDLPH